MTPAPEHGGDTAPARRRVRRFLRHNGLGLFFLTAFLLALAGQATRDDGLLAMVSACHPQTLRQMRWTNTLIKDLSPQILTSL
ncbi:hypothetical protein [Streptomyces thermoalcalitolerans]|uniref:Uncharacterized protein n=1 Tax=Streptomyces thermoalcalitolerans TaxID=65605 RepID=A0ABP3YNN9_9ACTN